MLNNAGKPMKGDPMVATYHVMRSMSANLSALLGGGSFAQASAFGGIGRWLNMKPE